MILSHRVSWYLSFSNEFLLAFSLIKKAGPLTDTKSKIKRHYGVCKGTFTSQLWKGSMCFQSSELMQSLGDSSPNVLCSLVTFKAFIGPRVCGICEASSGQNCMQCHLTSVCPQELPNPQFGRVSAISRVQEPCIDG